MKYKIFNEETFLHFMTKLKDSLDSKQNSIGYSPVNKAGDTITGDLVILKSLKSQLSIYELGEKLEDKYGSKSVLDSTANKVLNLEGQIAGLEITFAEFGEVSRLDLPEINKTTTFLRGDGIWAKPTDTTYSAGKGLIISGTEISHTNSITPNTYGDGGIDRELPYGGAFNIPTISYDSEGHIIEGGVVTLTLPEEPSEGAIYFAGHGLNLDETSNIFSVKDIYADKTGFESLRSLTHSISEVAGELKDLAFIAKNGTATSYLNGAGAWTTPPDTKYSVGSGLTLTADNKINHTNTITAGSAKEGGVTRDLEFSKSFSIPSVNFDSEGHISGTGSITLTLPENPNTVYSADESKGIHLDEFNEFSLTTSFRDKVSAIESLANSMSETVGNLGPVEPYPDVNSKYLDGTGAWSVPNDTKYVPGTGLSLEGNKFFVKDEYVKKVGDSMSGDLIMGNKDIINIRSLGLGTSTPNFGIDTVEDIRIRDDSSLKMGGVGAADVEFELEYDKESKSVSFNFFV